MIMTQIHAIGDMYVTNFFYTSTYCEISCEIEISMTLNSFVQRVTVT